MSGVNHEIFTLTAGEVLEEAIAQADKRGLPYDAIVDELAADAAVRDAVITLQVKYFVDGYFGRKDMAAREFGESGRVERSARASANTVAPHETNIGRIVLYLARSHEPGDFGDGSVNDPIVSIIDSRGSAAEFLQALATMSNETAAGIVGQLGEPDDAPF